MLPKGTISKIIEFFSKEPLFVPAMEEALCDFFNIEHPSELEKLQPNQMSLDFFNEWLVFDCELNTRRTVLEEYLFIHQKQLSRSDKKVYSDLISTNYYSLFRTDAIRRDKSISMTDMLTAKPCLVNERKATRQAVVGNYCFMRIATVGDHNEIVSADGFQLNPAVLPLRFIEDWKKRKIKFTPMAVYQQMLRPIEMDRSEQ